MRAAVLAAAVIVCGPAGAAPTQNLLDVWVVGVNGKARTNLTADEAVATSPSVSPDGRTIAFVNGDRRIWLMSANGANRRPLGPEPGELDLASGPTWSPAGRYVAYTLVRLVAGTECASWSIIVQNASNGALVAGFEDALSPSWSPRTGRVAFESNAAHCLAPGSLAVASLSGAARELPVKLPATAPAWSPDGKKLAFYCWSPHPGLCVVNADGSRRRKLAAGAPNDLDATPPAWSPDGSKIAFSTQSGTVRIMTVSSGRSRALGRGEAPSWSPSGKWIAAFSGSALKVWDAKTGRGRVVTRVEGGFRLVPPAWSPSSKLLYFTSA